MEACPGPVDVKICLSTFDMLCICFTVHAACDASNVPVGRLIKRIEDAERSQKKAEEALERELARSKELEIRWKAICSKKDSDLADCRQKMARLQVEASSKLASKGSWPLSPSAGSPRKRMTGLGDLDSLSVVSVDSSRRSSLDIDHFNGSLQSRAVAHRACG